MFNLFRNRHHAIVVAQLSLVLEKLENIVADLNTLKNDAALLATVNASAITLLQGLKAQLDAAIVSNDPQALADLSASIESQTSALAAAVTANTPAAAAPAAPAA